MNKNMLVGSREYVFDKQGAPRGTTSLWRRPKIIENILWRRKNGRGSSRHIRSSAAPTQAVTVKTLQKVIVGAPSISYFVMCVIQLMSLMLIPKNEIRT